MKGFSVGDVRISEGDLFLIAGPCVIESEKNCMSIAEHLKFVTGKLGVGLIFKASYDKANRLSSSSYRGPGLREGLKILARIKKRFSIPVLSDIHCKTEVKDAAKVLDALQIPAFLCRQTDLVVACAKTGLPVNIKKGQFMAPWDMKNIVQKIEGLGARKILLTERGFCFGYNNIISDMRSIVILKEFGYPVIYDATHSVQLPGGKGGASGGERKFVSHLARSAVAAGCDGIFLEVHENPDDALCDGPNMVGLGDVEELMNELVKISKVLKT